MSIRVTWRLMPPNLILRQLKPETKEIESVIQTVTNILFRLILTVKEVRELKSAKTSKTPESHISRPESSSATALPLGAPGESGVSPKSFDMAL
jgi:hypothetical protein